MGENEKQMLDPYAWAVLSLWHTHSMPRMCSRVGGGKGSWKFKLGCACVCAKIRQCGSLSDSKTLFKGMFNKQMKGVVDVVGFNRKWVMGPEDR